MIRQIGPKQSADGDTDQNQSPAHRWRASFAKVCFRTIVTHDLPDLMIIKFLDQCWTNNERNAKRGENAENAAHSNVLKYGKATIKLHQVFG